MNKVCHFVFWVVSATLVCATPAAANNGRHSGRRHRSAKFVSKSSGAGTVPVLTIDSATDTDASAHPNSSNGGVLHERANDVGGEHGEAGRANATHGNH
jgi:hypothetical protein